MLNVKGNFGRFVAIVVCESILLQPPDVALSRPLEDRRQKDKVQEKSMPRAISIPRSYFSSRVKKSPLSTIAGQPWREIGDAKYAISIATTRGKLFGVTKHNKLLVRDADASARAWKEIGDAGKAIAVTGSKGQLFAITKDNTLLVRDATPSYQKWRKVGDAGNAIGITAARGKLFGVTKTNKLLLRDTDTSIREWQEIGDAGNAYAITSIGRNLLGLTEDSKLLEREAIPGKGRWRLVGSANNIVSLLAAKGQLFALTKDGKLEFQPFPNVESAPAKTLAGIRIQDLPTWLRALFTPRHTNRRAMGSQIQPIPLKAAFEKVVTGFEKLNRPGTTTKAAAYEIGKVKKAFRAMQRKETRLEAKQLMMDESTEEILRVLIFDGPVELTQTLTHQGLAYPLDNPSIRVPPPSQYAGYLVVADRIVMKEDIKTKGNDLVLVAKEISVPDDVTRVSLNTKPPEMEQASQEREGRDSDNGGDLVFIAQGFPNRAKVQAVTTGGKGQDGGNGRPMSNPVTVTITKEETSIIGAILWGKFDFGGNVVGTIVDFKPDNSFYRNPPDCWFDRQDPVSGELFSILPAPPKDLYGLADTARESAELTTARIDISSNNYPSDGKSGGYGGMPGKISLIIPEAPGEVGIVASAETGSEGAPGKRGAGGEMKPTSVYLPTGDPAPLAIEEYISRNSKNRLRVTPRVDSDPVGSSPYAKDRFFSIQTMPKSRLSEALDRLEVTGAIKVNYYASSFSKQSGDESRLSEAWPVQPYLKRAAFLYRCQLAGLSRMWLPDQVSYYPKEPNNWPSTLGLIIYEGRDGASLSPAPAVTENVRLIQNNWYDAVYGLLPEYPERLAKRADKAYRAGDFPSALPFYQDVINFSNNSAFESDELVSDSLYRLATGNLGLDYFGFRPETTIPVSPSREVDLLTHYSSAVNFFNESIRDAMATGAQNENMILLLEEFSRHHTDMMAQIKDSIIDTQFELEALMLDMDAMRHEIDATYRANIRLGGLLESWVNFVNDRIEKLKAEAPTGKPDWQVALEAFWNVIQLYAAVISVVYSYVRALSKAADAWGKQDEIDANYNELIQAAADTDNLPTMTSEETEALTMQMVDEYSNLKMSADQFSSLAKSAAEELQKAAEKTSALKDKFEKLTTTSDAWTATEAVDFRNNVLLAEQIGVSGGLTYLQIKEQMSLNDDLLVAKQLALEAGQTRSKGLAERIFSLTQELLRQEANRRYLLDVIDALDLGNATTQSVAGQLNKIGQGDLDAMMRRLQEHTFQLKFLELTDIPSPGRYDRFIQDPVDVGTVLNGELQLRERINAWAADNANIGRLKVAVSRNTVSEIGKLIIVSPIGLDNFSAGEYVRPSQIYRIEPLRETQLVRNVADAVRARLGNFAQLVAILAEQYPEEIGPVTRDIVDRERQYHSILNVPAAALEDREVVLAYALALGGVTATILDAMISQSTLADPLKTSLQKLQVMWPTLSLEITNEDAKSVRRISQAVALERSNPSIVVTILNDAFTVAGALASLNRFHIDASDVQSETAASYDPDFPDYQVLGSINKSDDSNVLLAVTLLYAGLDRTQIEAVTNQYSTGDLIGDRLRTMLPEWDNLRRSVLERKHTLRFNIDRDNFFALPNISGTSEHRFLAGRAELVSSSGSLPASVVLKKLPEDRYEKKNAGTFTIAFPIEDQLLFPDAIASPPSFVLSDYHYNALFGRSVLGGWELSLSTKGIAPPLPNIQKGECEIIYSYRK